MAERSRFCVPKGKKCPSYGHIGKAVHFKPLPPILSSTCFIDHSPPICYTCSTTIHIPHLIPPPFGLDPNMMKLYLITAKTVQTRLFLHLVEKPFKCL